MWKRFAAIFAGYDGAFGTYDLSRAHTTEKGKVEGKALSLRGAPSPLDWQNHLSDSKKGLGIIPLRRDNTVKFMAIDVDDYRLKLEDVAKKVKDLPFVVCRSKSGGAHLYVFFKEPVLATVALAWLHDMAAQLGWGSSERFPKQTERYNDQDIGNWINIPYSGGQRTVRYALDPEGRAMSLDSFLDYAESKQVTEEELLGHSLLPALTSPSVLFEEGPPCLQHLEATGGFPDGTRNEGMFNVGVYLRKRFPDDWEDKMMPYAMELCDPPLTMPELANTVKSLKRKDYGYRCKQAPISAHCNRRECLKRMHGVGDTHHGTTVELENVIKYDGDPVLWGMDIGGKRVLVDTDVLYQQHRFNKLCMEVVNRCPTSMPPARWQRYLDDKIKNCDIVPVPEDASPEGQFNIYLDNFCYGRIQARSRDEISLGKPYRDEAHVHFRSSGLLKYLRQQSFRYESEHHIWQWLRKRQAENYFTTIKGKGMNVWKISVPKVEDEATIKDLLAPAEDDATPEVF